jgi:HEAT repeat protein
MPSFITVNFLLGLIAVGALVAVLLLLATVAGRVARSATQSYRAQADQRVRPLVLAVVAGEEVPPSLVDARGGAGRAAGRVILSYLAQLRGEAHDLLTGVLERRGAVDHLIRRSRSRWHYRRARAAESLGLIATGPAQQRLAELVNDDHSTEVRIVATRALGKAGSAAAAATLLSSLSRPDAVPEGIIASALLELGPDGVPSLHKALAPGEAAGYRQQAMAAEVLGLLDDMPSWQDLADCLASDDFEVRVAATRALGRLGVPQAAGQLAGCLAGGEQPALRAVAARALGRIADPRATPALAACLDDPDYWVAHNAAQALAALGRQGRTALERAAAAERPGAAHAREALARQALASGELPATPASATSAPATPGSATPAPPEPTEPAPASSGTTPAGPAPLRAGGQRGRGQR